MVLGRDTFAGDLLARLGVDNVYAAHTERYPRVDPRDAANAAGADLVVLPDEPYRFTADDGPEAFPGLPAALVDGRQLTWYGPSLARAPAGARPSAARRSRRRQRFTGAGASSRRRAPRTACRMPATGQAATRHVQRDGQPGRSA